MKSKLSTELSPVLSVTVTTAEGSRVFLTNFLFFAVEDEGYRVSRRLTGITGEQLLALARELTDTAATLLTTVIAST